MQGIGGSRPDCDMCHEALLEDRDALVRSLYSTVIIMRLDRAMQMLMNSTNLRIYATYVLVKAYPITLCMARSSLVRQLL